MYLCNQSILIKNVYNNSKYVHKSTINDINAQHKKTDTHNQVPV